MRRFGALGVAAALLLCCGCAGRGLLPEAESREAAAFFSDAALRFSYPASSSFSGMVEKGGDAFPFIAGVNARSAADETVGLYDPLGRVVMMMRHDGASLSLEAGPVAGPLAPLGGKQIPAGALSLGRILGGAPGFPVGRGEFRPGDDGGWQFSDGRQTLRTDPGRRFIAAAEYEIAGRAVTVSYPGRELASPPARVRLGAFGASIELRRDTEQ